MFEEIFFNDVAPSKKKLFSFILLTIKYPLILLFEESKKTQKQFYYEDEYNEANVVHV